MIPLLGVLAATVAAVTALHLRSRPRGDAQPFPSFQHLRGLAPRRRPAWPLEEPARWALRVLAVTLAGAALWLSRGENRAVTAVLVEPGSPQWSDARAFAQKASRPTVALSFEEGRPIVEASPTAAEAAERARRTIAVCSARYEVCLARAAETLAAEALVVSSFRERSDTFARLGPFRYLRTLPVGRSEAGEEPPKAGATRVLQRGTSGAARIWAAALAAADAEMGAGQTEIEVADRREETDGSRFVLVPVVLPGGPARAESVATAALEEDAALAAGTAVLPLESSLAIRADGSFRALVAPVLAASGRTILAAASEEDLGSWAHTGTLLALARVVLFESGRGIRVSRASPGSHRWTSVPSGRQAPVGIEDVSPGRYERDDRRVELTVVREAPVSGTLTDAELVSVKGRLLGALPPPPATSRWPAGLLAAALLLRLADAPTRRTLALAVFAAAVLALGLLAADPAFLFRAAVRPAALTMGRLSLPGSVRDPGCSLPGSTSPCTITARAAFADESVGANAVVSSPGRPRVDLASWQLPSEIRTGEAGLLRATVLVRRAAGHEVALSVRPTSGAATEVRHKVGADPEALTLSVPVRTATEGVAFALLRAAVGGEGDSAVVPIVTRSRKTRRLVLAASPGWEARAAGQALEKLGPVERITRLGATAVLARGAASEEPLDRLSRGLAGYDLVVLVGFTGEEMAGPREAALRRYVEDGGSLLFLGVPPRLGSLPLPQVDPEAAGRGALPSRVTGSFGDKTVTFSGFPAWKTQLPVAGTVLGRLDGAPWTVGRAVGKGRVAAFAAPDAWRVGGPGPGADYEAILYGVAAWLEAGKGGEPATLSPDLEWLFAGEKRVSLPATEWNGLPVDPVDPLSLLAPGPERERVLARRRGVPFLSADSPVELASLLSRVAGEDPLPRRVPARGLDAIWLALCVLLVSEVALRRRAARRNAPPREQRQAA